MEELNLALHNALVWLADAADEDCPVHSRTDDFNEALANARDVIDAALAGGVSK